MRQPMVATDSDAKYANDPLIDIYRLFTKNLYFLLLLSLFFFSLFYIEKVVTPVFASLRRQCTSSPRPV